MSLFWIITFIICVCVCFQHNWTRRYFYSTSLKFNGPISLPIVGATYLFFFCKIENFLDVIFENIKKYENPTAFWLGPKLVTIFKEPQHLEKIMNSPKFSHKHDIYDLMKDFLGYGLITASGSMYKLHKKKIQPNFNVHFSTECITVFEKHIDICIEKLQNMENNEAFDIGEIIHLCVADIIGVIAESILGYNFESQYGKNLKYIQAFTDVYKVVFERFTKPWLHSDIIFAFSKSGKRYKNICKLKNELLKKVTDLSIERRKLQNFYNQTNLVPVIDKIAEHIETNPDLDFEQNYWFHLITLYMASQDTITLIVSAACLCLGMYPEYQKKAVLEIYEVFGKNSSNLRYDDLIKLKYLDMILKETYRLFPIAPYILRKNLEDQNLDNWFLPKNCGILIPIYNLHKDSKYWDKPNDFYPNHFLPEKEQKRVPYSYMPFSAGPRSCIGKVFANISVKVLLIKLLQHFEFEASGELPDIKFTMDISIRSLNGYKVKIKRRSI